MSAETRVTEAEFEGGATEQQNLPGPSVPEIAFAGRSNVGKSSLMNCLLGRRNLVRTSGTPGCTRQINVFRAKLAGGDELRMVDLPGYGYAKVSKSETASWRRMIEGYLLTRPTLRAVVVLVDARRGVEVDDRQLFEFLARRKSSPISLVVVANKIDKLPNSKHKPTLDAIRKSCFGTPVGARVVGFSAATGEGREALWSLLLWSLRGGTG